MFDFLIGFIRLGGLAVLAGALAWPARAADGCPGAGELDRLEAQFVNRTLIDAASPGLTLSQGLCAQDQLVQRLAARLGPVVGYKAGLTSAAIRSRLSVKEPVRGTLLRDMMLASGSALPKAFGARGFMEMDLVVVVGDGAALQASTDPVAATAHVAALHPFIELPDWVFRDPAKAGAGDIASVNVGARAGILGPRIDWPQPAAGLSADAAWRHRLLGQLRASLRNAQGQVLASGAAAMLDGHPMNVVVWLAQHLKSQGVALRRGDLLSLGSMSPPIDPVAGDTYTLRYEGLDAPDLVAPGQVLTGAEASVRFMPAEGGAAASAGPADLEAAARRALKGLFEAIGSGQAERVAPWLATEFQVVRSDGAVYDRSAYLARSIPVVRQAPSFREVRATRQGDLVVVSLRLVVDEVIDGKQAESDAPQLIVFRANGESWQVVAAANLARLQAR